MKVSVMERLLMKLIKDIARDRAFQSDGFDINIDEMWDMETNENIEEDYTKEEA